MTTVPTLESSHSTHRASMELPDQSALELAGIDLNLDEARLVLCALSRLIADGTSKQRPATYHLARGLADVCRQDVIHFGEHLAAPFPSMPVGGWPSGSTALKHLGITGQDISNTWRRIKNLADDACLPLGWVLAFAPAPIWSAVAALISWGPAIAAVRMEAAVTTMATQTTTYDRRRREAGSPIARNTIEPRISAVWKLMELLVEMRLQFTAVANRSLDLGLIDSWTHKPPRVSARACGALDADQDNSGPTIEDCAQRIKELARANEKAPGYLLLRRLVLQVLLTLFGTRADALRTARVEDFVTDRAWPDGTRESAIRVFPGKTWHHAQAHYLPLPAEVADWLREWIAANGYAIGQAGVPLFPTTKLAPGDAPRPLSQPAFYQAVAGQQRGPNRGSLALMPRDGNRYHGFHPHAYRHTSHQLATRAGSEFKLRHPTRLAHVRAEEFAAALAGHKLDTSVSAIYRSLNRQELSCAVVPVMWEILWGEGSHRTGPNPTAIREARERCEFQRIMLRSLEHDLRGLQAEAERLVARAGSGPSASATLLHAAVIAGQRVLTKRDERDDCRTHLTDAETALKLAQETHLPLSDDLTDAEYDALLSEALGESAATEPNDNTVLAATLTVADAAELWDTTEQTIRRWIRGDTPNNRPAPWHDDAWETRTKKDRRLHVSIINTAALTSGQIDRLRLIRIRRAAHDAHYVHPTQDLILSHDPNKERSMTKHRISGRQMAGSLIDANETTGGSPPETERDGHDPRSQV